MATINTKLMCLKSCKNVAILTCHGCQQSFCAQHFHEHRQELSYQVDDIGHRHNLLRQELDSGEHTKQLLLQIDSWEHKSIRHIQETAGHAREILHQLVDERNNELNSLMDRLAKNVQERQDLSNYTEIDIRSWIGTLDELRQSVEQSSGIKIDYDNSAARAIPLITVRRVPCSLATVNEESRLDQAIDHVDNSQLETSDEKFNDTLGNITLSSDGLTALCGRTLWDGSCTGGIGRYSSKIHHIDFEVLNKQSLYWFVGIVNASQVLVKNISEVKSAYGWWELGFNVCNGRPNDKNMKKNIIAGDVLTLILNCDLRLIQLHHHRTDTIANIIVDLQECPLPWKIICRLDTQHDEIRILHNGRT